MRYDGIVICSDMDGTFEPTEQNINALKEFQAEGGKFSVATGRNIKYVKKYFKEETKGFMPNGPIAVCNGAGIFDLKTDCFLKEEFMPCQSLEIFKKLSDEFGFDLWVSQQSSSPENENLAEKNVEVDCNKMYKIVCKDTENIENLEAFVRQKFSEQYEVSKSYSSFLEINKKGICKGEAVKYIKEITNSHTLVCVGDYGNDISMLKAADISYAVGNATEEVKQAAMRVTIDYTNSAIAKIISEL